MNYASKLEANYAARLDQMKKAHFERQRVISWQRQVGVDLVVEGIKITRYYVDFVVQYADGHEEYVETKGLETDVWRIKSRLFRALFPERNYIVVKKV